MSSAESHLGLLDRIGRSVESLCEGELCCLGHRRKVSVLCLLYKIYHRVDHPMNEYLRNLVKARNTTASVALGELALVIPLQNKLFQAVLPACCWSSVERAAVGRVFYGEK